MLFVFWNWRNVGNLFEWRKIKDEFGLENNQIVKYKTTRNSIITIPYDLLRENNNLTIHIAGSAPSSFLAPNSLSGMRFKDGYILDYEKRLQESIQQTTLLLFNAVYIFFGLYHLFFSFAGQKKI